MQTSTLNSTTTAEQKLHEIGTTMDDLVHEISQRKIADDFDKEVLKFRDHRSRYRMRYIMNHLEKNLNFESLLKQNLVHRFYNNLNNENKIAVLKVNMKTDGDVSYGI